MVNDSFIEEHKKSVEFGFWDEMFKSTIIIQLERWYKDEVLRKWFIADIVVNGNKILLRWEARFEPLTDEELKIKYGR